MDKTKISLIIFAVILCSGLIVGAWYFIIGGSVKANIASIGSYKEATLTFEDMNLNTTTGSDKKSSMITFAYNREGIFNTKITETIADLSNGECIGGDKDCNTTYWLYDGVRTLEIKDGQNITIPSNSNLKYLSANLSCIAYSCPQTRDIIIKLNQIG